MTDSLLVENGTVLVPGGTPRALPRHSVLIEGDRIARVAPAGAFRRFRGRRIDASRQVVMPGLINAHTHCYSALARALTKTKPAATFDEVLKNLWWRLDSALTTEDCHASAQIALIDAIRHGATTIIDHHASPRAVPGSLAAIARAVQEELHKIGGSEECTGQLIQMHDYLISRLPSTIIRYCGLWILRFYR